MNLPPRGFFPAGKIVAAERCDRPTLATDPWAKPRHSRGLRYQRAVEGALWAWADQAAVLLEIGPWFRFRGFGPGVSDSAWRYCQPDVILDAGEDRPLAVLEIKLQFEPLAWWQLERLYRPVIEATTNRRVHTAVICGSWDPAHKARIEASPVVTFGSPAIWLQQRTSANYWTMFDTKPPFLPVLQWRKPSAAEVTGDGW